MSKNKVSRFMHLRIALHYLFNIAMDVVFVQCPFCRKFHIKLSNTVDNKESFYSDYKCLKCGATGKVTEIWKEFESK